MDLEKYPLLKKFEQHGMPKQPEEESLPMVPRAPRSSGLSAVLSSLVQLIYRRQGRKRGFRIRLSWKQKNLDVEYQEEE